MKTISVKQWSGRITGGGTSMGGVCTSTNIPLIWMHLKSSVEVLPVKKMWNCHVLPPTNPWEFVTTLEWGFNIETLLAHCWDFVVWLLKSKASPLHSSFKMSHNHPSDGRNIIILVVHFLLDNLYSYGKVAYI